MFASGQGARYRIGTKRRRGDVKCRGGGVSCSRRPGAPVTARTALAVPDEGRDKDHQRSGFSAIFARIPKGGLHTKADTMHNDSPDTIAIEDTQWVATEVDDVFLPSVRVQLSWKNVEAAVESGAVVPRQAHALWAAWASPTSGLRVGSSGMAPAFAPTQSDTQLQDLPMPETPGLLQRHGLWLGLAAGVVLGAAGALLLVG